MISDPLATGTLAVIEIVGGPWDGQQLTVEGRPGGPPSPRLSIPAHDEGRGFYGMVVHRGALGPDGVWRYHWREHT